MNWNELDWADAHDPYHLLTLHNVTVNQPDALRRATAGYPEPVKSRRPGERTLRLFAVSCWLTNTDALVDTAACALLDDVGRWADGELDRGELVLAQPDPTAGPCTLLEHAAEAAVGHALTAVLRPSRSRRIVAARAWRDLVPSPWQPRQDGTERCPNCDGDGFVHDCGLTGYTRHCYECNADRRGRDGQGRHRGRQPAGWLTPTVRALAAAAYRVRRPDGSLDTDAVGVLGDAAEEAGCTHHDLLAHLRGRRRCPVCRGAGCAGCGDTGWAAGCDRHYRGCWAVDQMLDHRRLTAGGGTDHLLGFP